MKKSARPMGELALIEQIRRDFGHPHGRHVVLGIGDDCAILRPPAGSGILVTTDLSLEDRHFRRDLHPPDSVGHRCLARGISDLAAMGATPLAAFLSLALPASLLASPEGRRWVNGFFRGLRKLADRYHVPLAGGDTSESPRETPGDQGLILADIVLLGSAPAGKALRRSGGRAGDNLYVTGHLGGAAAELGDILSQNTGRPCKPGVPFERSSNHFPIPPSPPLPRTTHRHRPIAPQAQSRLRLHRPERRPLHRSRPPLPRLRRPRRHRPSRPPHPPARPQTHPRSRPPRSPPRRRRLRTALLHTGQHPRPQIRRGHPDHPHRPPHPQTPQQPTPHPHRTERYPRPTQTRRLATLLLRRKARGRGRKPGASAVC